MNCATNVCPCHSHPGFMAIIVLLILIELVLKGFALWRAAQSQQKGWFIALLIVNSVGLLPLLYLFVVNKKNEE
jgi:hypothetical protein